SNLVGPLEFAKDHGLELRLRELRIAPASESFRRHIIYTDDAAPRARDEQEGNTPSARRFAVELKIPGENHDRAVIGPEHFLLARRLWDMYPANPGVVEP